MVKNRTLVPVIRSPPYSGIRSLITSQVAESPRYNGQSRPSSDNWLHIHLTQAVAGPADDNKRDDNKRKPNTWFVCPQYQCTFASRGGLRDHVKHIHHKLARYHCVQCGKGYSIRSCLVLSYVLANTPMESNGQGWGAWSSLVEMC